MLLRRSRIFDLGFGASAIWATHVQSLSCILSHAHYLTNCHNINNRILNGLHNGTIMQENVDSAAFGRSAFVRLECSAGASRFSLIENGGAPLVESGANPLLADECRAESNYRAGFLDWRALPTKEIGTRPCSVESLNFDRIPSRACSTSKGDCAQSAFRSALRRQGPPFGGLVCFFRMLGFRHRGQAACTPQALRKPG